MIPFFHMIKNKLVVVYEKIQYIPNLRSYKDTELFTKTWAKMDDLLYQMDNFIKEIGSDENEFYTQKFKAAFKEIINDFLQILWYSKVNDDFDLGFQINETLNHFVKISKECDIYFNVTEEIPEDNFRWGLMIDVKDEARVFIIIPDANIHTEGSEPEHAIMMGIDALALMASYDTIKNFSSYTEVKDTIESTFEELTKDGKYAGQDIEITVVPIPFCQNLIEKYITTRNN